MGKLIDQDNIAFAVSYDGKKTWHDLRDPSVKYDMISPDRIVPRARMLSDAEKQLGVVIPFYANPDLDVEWVTLAGIVQRYVRLQFTIIVDTDTIRIPDAKRDSRLYARIQQLRANGAIVLGRVNKNAYLNDREEIETVMVAWKSQYPDIDGIFLDNMSITSDGVDVYKRVVDYARNALHCKLVVGNLGQSMVNPGPEQAVNDLLKMLDILIIYEGRDITALIAEQSYIRQHGRNKLAAVFNRVDPTRDYDRVLAYVRRMVGAEQRIGHVYFSTDSGARVENPYYTLSSLLDAQARLMDQITVQEGNQSPPASAEKFIPESPPSVGGSGPNVMEGAENYEPQPSDRDIITGIRKLYPDTKNKVLSQMQVSIDVTKEYAVNCGPDNIGEFALRSGKDDLRFLNGEITFYFKLEKESFDNKTDPNNEMFSIYFRTDGDDEKSDGAAYFLTMYTNGQAEFRKRLSKDIEAPVGFRAQVTERDIKSGKTWIGYKIAFWNVLEEGKPEKQRTPVRMRLHIDDNCTDENGNLVTGRNVWRRMMDHMDRGFWKVKGDKVNKMGEIVGMPPIEIQRVQEYYDTAKSYAKSTKKGKPKLVRYADEIINTPGPPQSEYNIILLRFSDKINGRVKYFSYREIEAPRPD